MKNSTSKQYASLGEISVIYAIPLSTLRRWASERRFPLYKISNRIRVSIPDFQKWLEKHHVKEVS